MSEASDMHFSVHTTVL